MRPPLRKSLGQHHLRDGALCRPLVDFLRPAGARVVEIGPGGGVLTRELVAGGARVLALELDRAWAFHLRRAVPAASVALADALELDWSRLASPTLVAGNLPFNVGTRIVEDLLAGGGGVPRAAFLLQKEVADRLVAVPGDSAYGSFSLVVAVFASAVRLGTVRAGSFVPPPKVDAAFVGLTRRPPPVPPDEAAALVRTVRAAFARRRKTLRNNLTAAWGREVAETALAAAGVDGGARAEELPLAAFVDLHRAHSLDRGGTARLHR